MPHGSWNLPNQLSLVRLILCAIMAAVLSIPVHSQPLIVLLLFILASLTDWLDGHLARLNNQITPLGKLLDPLADKILICTAFIGLLQEGIVPLWIVASIMAREFLVTGLRLVAAAQGTVLAAEKLGKHKMITQVATIILGYIILTLHAYWIQEHPFVQWLYHGYTILLIITVTITLLSGIIYFYRNRHSISSPALQKNQPNPITPSIPTSQPTSQTSAPAFKEWSGIVDALSSGKQILILRKGGIHEGKDGFFLKHKQFWLFPTHFHEQAGRLREIQVPPPPPDHSPIHLTAYAQVTDAYFIHDPNLIPALSPFHYWKEEVIHQRFTQEEPRGLHLFILKIFRLITPITLPPNPAYGGCRSWITLPVHWENQAASPVLDENTFQSRRSAILKLLTPDLAEKLA